MKKINIQKIRKKLDKIDIKLLRIIKVRSTLVDQVVKLKKTKKEIIDQKRIKFILKRIKKNIANRPLINDIKKKDLKSYVKSKVRERSDIYNKANFTINTNNNDDS